MSSDKRKHQNKYCEKSGLSSTLNSQNQPITQHRVFLPKNLQAITKNQFPKGFCQKELKIVYFPLKNHFSGKNIDQFNGKSESPLYLEHFSQNSEQVHKRNFFILNFKYQYFLLIFFFTFVVFFLKNKLKDLLKNLGESLEETQKAKKIEKPEKNLKFPNLPDQSTEPSDRPKTFKTPFIQANFKRKGSELTI